jgi:KDO2-lipid IV(A) lauroyltransferase
LIIQTLIYYILRGILFCCAILPLSVLHGIAGVWGRVLYLLPSKAKDTTTKNLRLCFPNMGEQERDQLIKSSLINTACTALEMGKAWVVPVEKTLKLVVETEGYENYRKAVASDKGVILLAPHLSNWEVLGFYAGDGVPTSFMYQPPRIAALDRLLKEARSRSGIKMAPTNRKGVAEVLGALRQGEMVGILPDQVPGDESGIFSDFFGEPAFTMTLISKLVQRTGAKVICGFALRLPKGTGFRAVFFPADDDIYSSDLDVSVRALNKAVEDAVKQAPAQYQWEYKRFRRRPDNSEFYRVNE